MAVSLSIKNVPDKLAKRLRKQAALHHRSVQGELLSILEDALEAAPSLTLAEAHRKIQKLGFHTPDEATAMIREDRDAR
jgi:antitoxin FitA